MLDSVLGEVRRLKECRLSLKNRRRGMFFLPKLDGEKLTPLQQNTIYFHLVVEFPGRQIGIPFSLPFHLLQFSIHEFLLVLGAGTSQKMAGFHFQCLLET
jgi:hypothetical protein